MFAVWAVWAALGSPDGWTATASFRRDIAPVLVERCLRCHDEDVQKGGYRLDTVERLHHPGDSGKVPITPKQPEASHLFRLLITEDADDRMPQKGEPLDRPTVEKVRRWIEEGAELDGFNRGAALAEFAVGDFPLPPAHYPYPVPVAAVAFLGNAPGTSGLLTGPEPARPPGETPAGTDGWIGVGGYCEITIWGSEGGLRQRIANVPERIQSLVYRAEDQTLLFAGGAPGRAGAVGRVFLAGTQAPQIFLRTRDTLLALAVSPDGSRIAVGGTDRGIAIVDGVTLVRLRTITGHSDWVLDLAFSGDGRYLATASRDRTARVFDVSDGSLISAFREHKDAVTAVAFLEGSERVVTASKEGRLRSWNVLTGKDAKASEAVDAQVSRLVVRGDRILSAWSDGMLREHRADTLMQVRELGTAGEGVLALAISSNVIAAGHHNGRVRVWDSTTGESAHDFTAAP